MSQNPNPSGIIGAFTEELGELNKILSDRGLTDFVARVFIRTLFSIFDGYAFYVKQLALGGAAAAGITFTQSELEILTELRNAKDRHGNPETRPKIVPTRENLTMALKSYARVRGSVSPLPNSALPAEFKCASDARNRITHPKQVSDFAISASERQAIGDLLIWWRSVMEWVNDEELRYLEVVKRRIDESAQAMIEKFRSKL